jgi:hypothetical protein
MGWGFRRSLKLGPLKLNFSKSGVGYSVGVRGLRVGKDAKGRSYTAASIPGTGLYSRTYAGKGTAAGADAAPGSGTPPLQRAGNGLALVMAFIAGGLLVLFLTALFSSHPGYPACNATSGCECPCSTAAAYSCEAKAGPSLKEDCYPRKCTISHSTSIFALIEIGVCLRLLCCGALVVQGEQSLQ